VSLNESIVEDAALIMPGASLIPAFSQQAALLRLKHLVCSHAAADALRTAALRKIRIAFPARHPAQPTP